MLRTLPISIILGTIALFAQTAEAATLFFTPGSGEFGINKEIVVDLKIDSEGAGINAAQATLRFPKDILEVKSINKTDSTFNFWLEEPSFSNTDGVISFVGGTPYGISGASIQVLHVVFTTKTGGTAPLNIVDAAVTASDGSGTNVLTKTTDATFTISPAKTAPAVVVPPTQIVREATPAAGLPTTPVLNVPFYADPALWYNHSNVFTASWELPRDVTGVATTLNNQPNFTPNTNEGLFDNKMFQPLADGVSYLHVRFKNSIGWGGTAHYRIAVDTKAPVPFEITSSEGATSDNPAPTLTFASSDALSGIHEYRIKTDNEAWITIPSKDFQGSYKLSIKNPGTHHITIQAVDNAGNSIENTLNHETLALVSPVFTFTTETLFSDETKGLTFKGTAIPSTEILLLIKRDGAIIANSTVNVSANGNWEFTFADPLRNGKYIATIQNRDSRGALSLVVTAPEISVTGRYTNLVIVLLLVLIVTIIAGSWFYKNRRERTALRIQMAERDTANVFKMIQDDVKKLQEAQKSNTSVNAEFIAEKINKNVEKMGKYIKDEIGRAKD
ncbi:MAG: Ig-like domain-containing protein [Candidatus Pacebacteria bacterium]|jgi:hypothetical protein|nr:Ig-like domain-containing protein [Candidatus Paceibacterota bacterium]